MLDNKYDCIIIGGGIFGLYTATLLASNNLHVALIEQEPQLFSRASKNNQSRIHRGYHYPRSFDTAKKASDHYQRFCEDFSFALLPSFIPYYAISYGNSKVSAEQYYAFCRKLEIPLKEVDSLKFFQTGKVEATFRVDEQCFNYALLARHFEQLLIKKCVDIYCSSYPIKQRVVGRSYIVTLNTETTLSAPMVVNATYSHVNKINDMFGFRQYETKYELCELALCRVGPELTHVGITIVDGPFFSLMPFGDGSTTSLSSVHYTPIKTSYLDPQDIDLKMHQHSNWEEIFSLARSYLQPNYQVSYQQSIFEIKPILLAAEKDDARPTVVVVHGEAPYFISVLSGKISSIYELDPVIETVVKKL